MRRIGINKKGSIKCKLYREKKIIGDIDYSDPYAKTINGRILISEIELIIKDNYSYNAERYGDHISGKTLGFCNKSYDIRENDTIEGVEKAIGKSYKVVGDQRNGLYYKIIHLERIK